jgi:hypothetical protein
MTSRQRRGPQIATLLVSSCRLTRPRERRGACRDYGRRLPVPVTQATNPRRTILLNLAIATIPPLTNLTSALHQTMFPTSIFGGLPIGWYFVGIPWNGGYNDAMAHPSHEHSTHVLSVHLATLALVLCPGGDVLTYGDLWRDGVCWTRWVK